MEAPESLEGEDRATVVPRERKQVEKLASRSRQFWRLELNEDSGRRVEENISP